jgi:hypothetical protein
MTYGPEYLVYALDEDEPLFAKGKWAAKRAPFWQKDSTKLRGQLVNI